MEFKLDNINIPKEYREFIEYERKVAYLDVIGLYEDYTMEFIKSYYDWLEKQPKHAQESIEEYIYDR